MVRSSLLAGLATLVFCFNDTGVSADQVGGAVPTGLIDAKAFERLDLSAATTGVLIDRSRARSRIGELSGEASAARLSRAEWLDVYFDLRMAASSRDRFPEMSDLYARHSAAENPERVPIALLDTEYDRLRPDLFESGDRLSSEGRFALKGRVTGPVTERRRVFGVASLRPSVVQVPGLHLMFPSDLYLGAGRSATRIRVSVAGGPWQEVKFDQAIPMADVHAGAVNLDVEMRDDSGASRVAHTQLMLEVATAPTPTESFNVIAQNFYSGTYATARVHILLAPSHTVLTRPLMVLDGFDTENADGGNNGWNELYAVLNQQLLADRLRSLGFDIVIVDYTDALRYIQDNAFAVVAAISAVRSRKVGAAPTVLVGPSMGGLVARYALDYMEAAAIPHGITRFISFDSPQKFANIPQGDQHLIKFMSNHDDGAAEKLDMLLKPAAGQMLVTTTAHPSVNEWDDHEVVKEASQDGRRTALFNELQAMGGYPTQPELVAIANGSGSGTPQSAPNNTHMLIADGVKWEFGLPVADIYLQVFPVPGTAADRVFFGKIEQHQTDFDIDRLEIWRSAGPRYDQAPGGMRNTQYEIAVQIAAGLQQGVVDPISPDHCFIPTVSALDFDSSNLFYNILGDPLRLQKTPFDRIYAPTSNLNHVEINGQIATWMINEAIGAPLPMTASLDFPDVRPGGGGSPLYLRTGDALNVRWTVNYGAEPNFATTTIYLVLDQTPGSTVNRTVWPIATLRRTETTGAGTFRWILPGNTYGDIRIPGIKTLHKIQIVTKDVNGNTVADESTDYFSVEWFGKGANGDDEPEPTEYAIVAPGVGFSGVRPNPSSAPIRFGIKVDKPQLVTAELYDSQGRRVSRFGESAEMSRGTHWFSWDGRASDGSRAPAGIYFLRIGAGARQSTFKTVLLSR